ncbi:VWA domain-containing protein [Ureibacillus chungkukjangi]|uniref:Stress response protein SCP2 n=1 Tax=Ureibacillus chungkukjangi TaxID=1202712 RepID=A0A318TUF6_9BACL|nr:VWA domain-containing protein [Ureibacillus chungkukjangi]PYF08486.1 stress response protein SCP2 [Ureibacillus chungkukjangi]
MKTLIRGEKVNVSDFTSATQLEVEVNVSSSFEIDITCFGLDQKKQLTDDRYMIFYNQLNSPSNEIQLRNLGNGSGTFFIDLAKIPTSIQYLVFTATIDGNGTMGMIQNGSLKLKTGNQTLLDYSFNGNDFKNEKAVIITEVYNYKSLWKVSSVGSGFDGGLSALLTSFGGTASEEQAPANTPTPVTAAASESQAAPTPVLDKKILLEKKMEQTAPKLLDLSKKAKISLEKAGLQNHTAKVALCLDISGSMSKMYRSGKIQEFVERILALGTRFDDDGSIDVFLFGKNAYDAGEITIDNFGGSVDRLIRQHPLEGNTYYGKAMKIIRKHYFGHGGKRDKPYSQKHPVYVMFVTDGAPFDRADATNHIQHSSYEPMFWQFMAIGKSNKGAKKKGGFFNSLIQSDFTFLEQLDNLSGRYLDNANFFSVEDPLELSDTELYDLLMTEYPGWVKSATQKGLIQ